MQTYGHISPPSAAELVQDFGQLTNDKTRIIFLGSRGVFRGAFHIAVLAAMEQTGCLPDIVAGASVGTLTGGALCRMTATPALEGQRGVVADLTNLFTHVDRFFADGGMFDNLPFFPAIEVMADVQNADVTDLIEQIEAKRPQALALMKERWKTRSEHPSIIVCAGLNEKPTQESHVDADTMLAIHQRAATLSYESKTNTFIRSGRTGNQLFAEILACDLSGLTKNELIFLNRFVPAVVVDITPIDRAHINPTFAFCKTLGLGPLRVQSSIADGRFQTLRELERMGRAPASKEPAIGQLLREKGLLATQELVTTRNCQGQEPAHCPYLEISGAPFECPFSKMTGESAHVFKVCKNDPAHRELC